jgi:predicted peroxiredoxin
MTVCRPGDWQLPPGREVLLSSAAPLLLRSGRYVRNEENVMASYLLIESRDPLESADVQYCYDLAAQLAAEGNTVTLFLVQNGVTPARRSPASAALEPVVRAGVEILADEFSLRERGIAEDRMTPAVKAAPLDIVIDQLVAGRKAIWH